MNTPVTAITCPKCARTHALFYRVYVERGKLKKNLVYRCDHAERISSTSTHEGNPIPIRTTAILMAPDNVIVPVEGLPEEYTPAARQVINRRAQMQLAIPTVRK